MGVKGLWSVNHGIYDWNIFVHLELKEKELKIPVNIDPVHSDYQWQVLWEKIVYVAHLL